MTAYADSLTMLRRNLRHALRYPGLTVYTIIVPVAILLLFSYTYGDALGAGIASALDKPGDYIEYIAPGVILMAAAAGAIATAVAVCTDMTEGIINRFKVMSISRGALLTGHVVGSMLQTLVAVAVVFAIAVAIGFRPDASPAEWLGAIGLLVLATFALTWLSAAFGLSAKTIEGASNAPMPLQFLPFLGSAIVPTDTMPAGLRAFAENQPFTPINETLRGLLTGTHIGHSGIVAVAWCVGLSLVGYVWARRAYDRERAPA